MMRRAILILIVLLTLSAGSARAEVLLTDFIEVLGNVSFATRPVDNAVVIAFNLSTYYVAQTFTDSSGGFRLPPLPAGIYRVIAVKSGFVPAVSTIQPNRKDHQVNLKLRSAPAEDAKNAIWEIRRSLPSDVLREIDAAEFAEIPPPPDALPRLSAEMSSLRAVDPGREVRSGSYAQTAVGLRGNLGRGWTVDFSGSLQQIDSVESASGLDEPIAASSGVSMEFRSLPSAAAYRIDSTKNSWRLDEGAGEVDLQAHNFEWQRANSSVQVRYVSHENLFENSAYDAEVIEVSGESRLQQSSRSDFDVFLKVGQENFTGIRAAEEYRTAAVSATGRYAVVPQIRVRYGMHTYVTDNRSEWAPETGAEFQVGKNTAILIAGLYKVARIDSPDVRLPSVMFLNQSGAMSPKYRYSVGLVSGNDERGLVTAAANVAEIDSLVRVVFDDRFDQFWDAFFLQSGDQYQDLTVSVRKNFGSRFILDLTTAAGRAESPSLEEDIQPRSYLTGSVQSLYRPSGTSLEVSYRQVEQPHMNGDVYDSERLNLRMGQSLHLPLDVRVLLGVDLSRAPESPALVDSHDPSSVQRRLVGGFSLAF